MQIFTYVLSIFFIFSISTNIIAQEVFRNPLLKDGPDPFMYKHTDGFYYTMVTTSHNLEIKRSKTITGLNEATSKIIWSKPASGPNSHELWAPEIHFIKGKWYIYYTATDVKNPGDQTRFVFVLESSSPDPFKDTWVDKGKVNTNYPGLDGSTFEYNGQRYFLYSAYVGKQSVLAIAKMKNPWTLETNQTIIAYPTYDWEKHDGREILEGPQFLQGRNGKFCIIYSASACWDDNYCLGMLTTSDPEGFLSAEAWSKREEPVFKSARHNKVYGPGHNCFTKSPDDKEDWIIYHAKDVTNAKCSGRSLRAQKFTWNLDGTPYFGEPLPIHIPVLKPSGEESITN